MQGQVWVGQGAVTDEGDGCGGEPRRRRGGGGEEADRRVQLREAVDPPS